MTEPGSIDPQAVPPEPPPPPDAPAPGSYPPPPPAAALPGQRWQSASRHPDPSAPTAWPGGEAPGSRRPMVAMAIAVLAIVGIGVAWATFNGIGRAAPSPATADGAVGTAVPGRPVDVGHLGSASDQASLARALPPDLAAGCEPVNVTTPQLAAARCTTSDGYVLLYESYADRDTLNFAWRHELYEQDLTMDSGDCETGEPGEDGWYYEDSTQQADEGRDACFLDPAGPVLLWTDYGTNVRAWMHGNEDSSIQSMYARWVDGTFDPRR